MCVKRLTHVVGRLSEVIDSTRLVNTFEKFETRRSDTAHHNNNACNTEILQRQQIATT